MESIKKVLKDYDELMIKLRIDPLADPGMCNYDFDQERPPMRANDTHRNSHRNKGGTT
jgi:hypothetical protein